MGLGLFSDESSMQKDPIRASLHEPLGITPGDIADTFEIMLQSARTQWSAEREGMDALKSAFGS
ncbi:hypothetical protein LTS10_008854 [Elasticomyces elasticus]|nr:hypothetical protein LTS10_008854 [Elasticomyces elasticus]